MRKTPLAQVRKNTTKKTVRARAATKVSLLQSHRRLPPRRRRKGPLFRKRTTLKLSKRLRRRTRLMSEEMYAIDAGNFIGSTWRKKSIN